MLFANAADSFAPFDTCSFWSSQLISTAYNPIIYKYISFYNLDN